MIKQVDETYLNAPERYSLQKLCSDEEKQFLVNQNKNLRYLLFAFVPVLGFAIYGCIHLGAQAKIETRVFLEDQTGKIRDAGKGIEVKSGDLAWAKIKRTFFEDFVADWRGVTTDQVRQKMMWDRAVACVGSHSSADTFLNDRSDGWYAKNYPFDRAAKGVVTVEIESSGPVSDNTWETWWDETYYQNNGAKPASSRWRGVFTYMQEQGKPDLYITQIQVTPVAQKEAR